MPFLCTLRGDKLRMVWNYLASPWRSCVTLGAEIVITGHGEPIRGAATIRADIDRMIGAVRWIRDYTHDGMNAGKTVHQLMRDVQLPEALKIGEFHGKVSWAVKTDLGGICGLVPLRGRHDRTLRRAAFGGECRSCSNWPGYQHW